MHSWAQTPLLRFASDLLDNLYTLQNWLNGKYTGFHIICVGQKTTNSTQQARHAAAMRPVIKLLYTLFLTFSHENDVLLRCRPTCERCLIHYV